ncbi:hypothetical protein MAHJHV55_54150 [Mycobacterium avium subsp. hominissuis]
MVLSVSWLGYLLIPSLPRYTPYGVGPFAPSVEGEPALSRLRDQSGDPCRVPGLVTAI